MHAGTGIVHAEYNQEKQPTRLFQIWIQPDRHGAAPGWGTRQFPREGGLAVLASGRAADADSGALPLNADAAVLAGTLAGRRDRKADPRAGAGRLPGAHNRFGRGQRHAGRSARWRGDLGRDRADHHRIENTELVLVDVAAVTHSTAIS